MFRKALDFFSHESIEQQEREAIIDLLNLLCHIDGKIKLREQDYIDQFVENIDWHSGTAKETFLAMSVSRARAAVEGNHVDEFIDNIAARIPDKHYKQQAMNMAEAIALSDETMNSKEARILGHLKDKLV